MSGNLIYNFTGQISFIIISVFNYRRYFLFPTFLPIFSNEANSTGHILFFPGAAAYASFQEIPGLTDFLGDSF